jgi:hypothetical protein
MSHGLFIFMFLSQYKTIQTFQLDVLNNFKIIIKI